MPLSDVSRLSFAVGRECSHKDTFARISRVEDDTVVTGPRQLRSSPPGSIARKQ